MEIITDGLAATPDDPRGSLAATPRPETIRATAAASPRFVSASTSPRPRLRVRVELRTPRRPSVDRVAIAVGAPGAERPLEAVAALAEACRGAVAGAAVPVDVLPVEPWGKFTPALNVLVSHAARTGCGLVLFASVETAAAPEAVAALKATLRDRDAFVAGAALPGHDFRPGARALGGRTSAARIFL